MAGNKVGMTRDLMENRITQFQTNAEEVDTLTNQITSRVNQMLSEWEGEAPVAFANLWETDLKKGFNKASQALMQLSQALTSSMNNTFSTDAGEAKRYTI
ncbi:MAG: WXG100 family type VII secretion target [Clostridiales Family XIII bacterium]|jgi:WXG100 family type VII secretion target|nr:WXG100 family type VII secretion target [Clostridiales Family XIII bacterium]